MILLVRITNLIHSNISDSAGQHIKSSTFKYIRFCWSRYLIQYSNQILLVSECPRDKPCRTAKGTCCRQYYYHFILYHHQHHHSSLLCTIVHAASIVFIIIFTILLPTITSIVIFLFSVPRHHHHRNQKQFLQQQKTISAGSLGGLDSYVALKLVEFTLIEKKLEQKLFLGLYHSKQKKKHKMSKCQKRKSSLE